MANMKLTINIDEHYTETEITVNCSKMNDEINKMIASIQMADMKIPGRKNGCEHILEIADIIFIESVDKRTLLYTFTDSYENSFKLYELEAKLIHRGFLRASKNCLVNINFINSIETESNSRLILTMPKSIKLIVSRQYAAEIKQKLESQYV
jgi:DNA-binding LytR/AlgR family response regulator